MIFDENTLGIKLLNSSSCLLHSDPFDIVVYIGSIIPFFGASTSQMAFVPESIGSNQPTLTKILLLLIDLLK